MRLRQFRIGTRKSALAKVQSEGILRQLETQGLDCRLVEIVSRGDQDRTTPLYQFEPGSPGLFTKQLETALLDGTIDLAVHSLKDLPTQQPEGLEVAAVPRRVDPADCLLIAESRFAPDQALGLPRGARVGTSSLRREAQLLADRPDLEIFPLRGNVPTRVQAAASGKLDAVVLAEAGLLRLELDLAGVRKLRLDPDRFVGAPGQGALALETRQDCPVELRQALERLHDAGAALETRVERAVLRELEGGCTLPLGVLCRAGAQRLTLRAFLGVPGTGTPRSWTGFHRFDIFEARDENRPERAVEQALIAKTVQHFQTILKS
jgi:hydroxymethylbilane synthase